MSFQIARYFLTLYARFVIIFLLYDFKLTFVRKKEKNMNLNDGLIHSLTFSDATEATVIMMVFVFISVVAARSEECRVGKECR